MAVLDLHQWDDFLFQYPDAHVLQTGEWGQLKAAFGGEVARLAAGQPGAPRAGAQILFRRLPLGFSLAYIPRGPVGPWADAGEVFWREVDAECRRRRAIFLKVEPDCWEEAHSPSASLPAGFRPSPHSIQPQRTLVVSLQGSDEELLARMKQKTRYNIRLAQKKGVVIRPSADIETFYRLMVITGGRDSFGVHSLEYYRRAYELFHPHGACELLMAEYAGEPLAGLMVFARGRRAWYFYGASGNEHRDRMPTYILQWEAMRWARQQGCQEYDLWGIPDEDEATLEANFTSRRSGLWGVYRFKRGFGGRIFRAAGPWDRVYNPVLYALYRLYAGRRTPAA
ncbi:MAG: peptidoglycan bridge formation glycyltransferase FemA/FemB family protein [Chloroflexi bacterium]|nr:peptidoglycan bridge formation glycyltransferase FemA/FemB family protein [Chloroflexota bacterium]